MRFLIQSPPPELRLLAAAASIPMLSACSGAPSQNVLGSYFPSWLFCALLGLALTLALRALAIRFGIDAQLPVPALIYLALALMISCAVWLGAFG